ncbi:hypothetical protein ACLOJK_004481 [Asimina triloba]
MEEGVRNRHRQKIDEREKREKKSKRERRSNDVIWLCNDSVYLHFGPLRLAGKELAKELLMKALRRLATRLGDVRGRLSQEVFRRRLVVLFVVTLMVETLISTVIAGLILVSQWKVK